MGVLKRIFGQTNQGSEVYAYTLANQHGCTVELLSLGAIIHSIILPDRHGNMADVVTGLQTVQDYEKNPAFFGAIIGRVTNRLHGGHFKVKGQEFKVNCNLGDVFQHGGLSGFDKKLWTHQSGCSDVGQWVELTYLSIHGEEGFPGNLSVKAIYTLHHTTNTLSLRLSATTDLATLINLTNHTYFNLAAHNHGSLKDHELKVNASHYLPLNNHYVPTGEIKSVKLTQFDLTNGRNLGQVIEEVVDFAGIKGIDHNFCVSGCQGDDNGGYHGDDNGGCHGDDNGGCHGDDNGGCHGDDNDGGNDNSSKGNDNDKGKHGNDCHSSDNDGGKVKTVAVLKDLASGRTLTLQTNQPGLQVYTGNHLDGSIHGKASSNYHQHSCIALEAQKYPNAPHHPNFPSIVLEPGQEYCHLTVYAFSID